MKKMKKDENKSFFYFLTFMFLALLLFASTGVYDNVMTGAAVSTGSLFDSVDFLSESVRGIMKLFFEGIFEPVFGYALDTEQTAQVVLRVMIFLFLLFIISPIFAKNDNFKKYSWILGGIISLVSAIFFPSGILTEAKSFIASIVVVGMVISSLIVTHKWEGISSFWKSFVYLILFFLIVTFHGLIDDLGSFNNFYNTIFLLSSAVSILASGFYLIDSFGKFKVDWSQGPRIGLSSLWPFGSSHTNPAQSNPINSQTPQQTNTNPTQPTPQQQVTRGQVRENVQRSFNGIMVADSNIRNEFNNPRPSVGQIRHNLEIIRDNSREISAIITNSGFKGGNFNATLSFADTLSHFTNKVLGNNDINYLKRTYDEINNPIRNMQGPVSGL